MKKFIVLLLTMLIVGCASARIQYNCPKNAQEKIAEWVSSCDYRENVHPNICLSIARKIYCDKTPNK